MSTPVQLASGPSRRAIAIVVAPTPQPTSRTRPAPRSAAASASNSAMLANIRSRTGCIATQASPPAPFQKSLCSSLIGRRSYHANVRSLRRASRYLWDVSIAGWKRTIAHLDMDAFYASVELRRHPELRGKPVVVCGSGPRAVVTTASYEARKLAGIHSAMPASVARRRLPNAVYIPPDFPAYREASAVVMEVMRSNVEIVEVVGLDEAYLDLTGIFSPKATMRRIKAEIRELTGLTCSVGIAESRLLAKMTSELGKPNGMVVVSREDALARFGGGPPGVVPGIGPKTVERLEKLGITTLSELGAWDRADLEAR